MTDILVQHDGTIATVVFLHITGAIAFLMAALAMGLASLLF